MNHNYNIPSSENHMDTNSMAKFDSDSKAPGTFL